MAQLSELWVQFVGLPNISVTIHGRMISDFFFPVWKRAASGLQRSIPCERRLTLMDENKTSSGKQWISLRSVSMKSPEWNFFRYNVVRPTELLPVLCQRHPLSTLPVVKLCFGHIMSWLWSFKIETILTNDRLSQFLYRVFRCFIYPYLSLNEPFF